MDRLRHYHRILRAIRLIDVHGASLAQQAGIAENTLASYARTLREADLIHRLPGNGRYAQTDAGRQVEQELETLLTQAQALEQRIQTSS